MSAATVIVTIAVVGLALTPVIALLAVDPATLHEVERRAAAQGTDVSVAAAEALRAGAHAA